MSSFKDKVGPIIAKRRGEEQNQNIIGAIIQREEVIPIIANNSANLSQENETLKNEVIKLDIQRKLDITKMEELEQSTSELNNKNQTQIAQITTLQTSIYELTETNKQIVAEKELLEQEMKSAETAKNVAEKALQENKENTEKIQQKIEETQQKLEQRQKETEEKQKILEEKAAEAMKQANWRKHFQTCGLLKEDWETT